MQNDKSQKTLKPTKIGTCIHQITVSNKRLFVLLLRKLLEKKYTYRCFQKNSSSLFSFPLILLFESHYFSKKIKPDQGLRIVLIFVLLLFSVQFNTYTHAAV